MANVLVEENSLTAIANSIRGKNGTTNTYKPGEMSAAIDAIETGGAVDELVTTYDPLTFHDEAAYGSCKAIKFNQITLVYRWTGTSNIWPCVDFKKSPYTTTNLNGHRIRIRFKLWTDSEEGYPMANRNVYFSAENQFDLGTDVITTTPYQFEAMINSYVKPSSVYEPVLHVYPQYTAGRNLYISDVVVEDLDSQYVYTSYQIPSSMY